MKKINSLTGMVDLLPSKSNHEDIANKIYTVERKLKKIFEKFSFFEIRTPALEHTALFERSVGESSDIVNKELYTFLDKNDNSICLRPEGTASVIRSVIEKKLDGDLSKFYYLGPMWRYERPQKGRFRQFFQAGVEVLGYPEGLAELELVSMICNLNKEFKINNPVLKINHLGNPETKEKFSRSLLDYLNPMKSDLNEKDLSRLKNNPLRVLDSKDPKTQEILKDAPSISDYLPKSSLELLLKIKKIFSEECNIKIDHNLVRGLDYYSGFVFESISSDLGAQDAYLGGGRYDNLCSQLGGKDMPAIGMAIGIERLALISSLSKNSRITITFIVISNNNQSKAYKIAHNLRATNKNIYIDVQLSDASLKSKLRRANKDNASYAVIIGDEELESNKVILKPLNIKDSEQTVMTINELKKFIQDLG